ncbi:2OG-Fe(II) oxygenase [Marinomonas pollencensis]|uniref:SM-20-related protein n=1 Tax=Marinomonas pollencensis TaxID=491954 RepID=A0A3E0DUS1_9GAMM|nr:2OG-Fe(II) oxygenase [Marinomonas pollencensis]REG85872.1 SM-20-related protein [Marinomonas pollencensis]
MALDDTLSNCLPDDLPEDLLPAFSRHEPFALLLSDLQAKGWSIQDDFFSAAFTDKLMAEVQAIQSENMLQAGVGRKQSHQLDLSARRDYIKWIDPINDTCKTFLDEMEALRIVLNRQLFLGLFDFEAHFARYEDGAFYEKHLDAFKGQSNRILSTVLYLNDDWRETDGGELIIYDEYDEEVELGRFLPKKGRLAVFLSECFPHEVNVAKRTRHSIAGWFRVNNTTAKELDPGQ